MHFPLRLVVDEVHQRPGGAGSDRANGHHLKTLQDLPAVATVLSKRDNGLDVAEYEQGDEHDNNRDDEPRSHDGGEEIWDQRHEAAEKVAQANGQGTGKLTALGGGFQALAKANDKVNEVLGLRSKSLRNDAMVVSEAPSSNMISAAS